MSGHRVAICDQGLLQFIVDRCHKICEITEKLFLDFDTCNITVGEFHIAYLFLAGNACL